MAELQGSAYTKKRAVSSAEGKIRETVKRENLPRKNGLKLRNAKIICGNSGRRSIAPTVFGKWKLHQRQSAKNNGGNNALAAGRNF